MGTVASFDYDVAVIGAGIIGLATAAELAGPRCRVLLVERHDGICRETSSRNSEVVHGGIHYPPGSLKARSCVAGRRALYDRCAVLGIDAPQVGKLIVATQQDELAALEQLAATGAANGVEGLVVIDRGGVRAREREVEAIAALWSPGSGIVDSHRYAASFLSEAEAAGADVVFETSLVGADPIRDGYELWMTDRDQRHPFVIRSRQVVNTAGLGQPEVSSMVGIDAYPQHPCKGVWFSISARHRGRLRSLVYPVGRADAGGLGVHICLDVGGGLRLGPDVEWVEGPPFDLDVDASRRDAFWEAAHRYLPWLEPEDLAPDMAGVRAKLVPEPGMWRDFVVAEESERGLPGWVTLAGIESPGLTAATYLAGEVRRALAVGGGH